MCPCVNRDAALILARAFAQLAMGEHPSGFHAHVHEDLDSNEPEVFVLGVSDSPDEG